MNYASDESFRHIRCLHQIWCGGFDVILVIGQSNATSRGIARRPILEESNDRIYQIGRDSMDFVVIPAREPLSHVSVATQGMGFALPFARHYRDEFLEPKRLVLIVPCAKGGTSVARKDGYWRPGGEGHQDVRARLAAALHPYRDSRLAAILWHQGENDSTSDQQEYRRLATELLTGIRDEFAEGDTPIILGELAMALRQTVGGEAANESIHHLAGAIPNAGLACRMTCSREARWTRQVRWMYLTLPPVRSLNSASDISVPM